MRIVCPRCQSAYDVKAEALGAAGRTVRCADCGEKWFQALAVNPPPTPVVEIDPWAEVEAEEQAMAAKGAAQMAAMDMNEPSPEELHEPPRGPRLLATKSGKSPKNFAFKPSLPLAALACLLAVLSLALLFRTSLVRLQPNLAGVFASIGLPVNIRGLALEAIAPRLEAEGSRQALVVTGNIRNLTRSERDIPQLRLAILDASGKETAILSSPPPQEKLAGGATIAFSTRLAVPSGGGERFELRFSSGDTNSLPVNH